MVVRPLEIKDDNLLFYQGQISQHDVNKKSRQALNLGLGYRMLSDDGDYFSGVNTFLDVDSEENYRAGVGFELRSSSFELNGNYYNALSGEVIVGDEKNRALNGYDISAVGQVPYLPWADFVFTSYEWEAEQNSKNSKGEVYKGQFYLTKSLSLEAGIDDNNITLEDNFFRLTYVYPPKDRTTLQDGFISDTAFENSDIRKEMLTKVKRSNKIVVEVEASGVVISNGNS
jgi:adhesin/invasin